MNERTSQMNNTPDQRTSSAADFVYMRSTGYSLSYLSYGFGFGYTGGQFISGRSYRS